MRWVEANRDLLPKEDVDYCNNIIRTGHEAIAMRDEGLTLEDTLADLDKSVEVQEKKHKTRLRREVYLELERMIRTVFRHPDMTIEEYNRQFFAECISVGRY